MSGLQKIIKIIDKFREVMNEDYPDINWYLQLVALDDRGRSESHSTNATCIVCASEQLNEYIKVCGLTHTEDRKAN